MNILNNIEQFSDAQLIDKYKLIHDKSIVGELYKRHTSFVFLVCMKYLKNKQESQDAVMQIFEKLFDLLLKHNIENFKPWLHTVTKNYCLLQIRNFSHSQKKEQELKKDLKNFVENFDEVNLINEKEIKLNQLEKAIEKLNTEQQECINLFYIQEKSYKEIADITGYDIKNVKSFIQNGKRNIKLILENLKNFLIIWFIINN